MLKKRLLRCDRNDMKIIALIAVSIAEVIVYLLLNLLICLHYNVNQC
jgi:hypothetical protein